MPNRKPGKARTTAKHPASAARPPTSAAKRASRRRAGTVDIGAMVAPAAGDPRRASLCPSLYLHASDRVIVLGQGPADQHDERRRMIQREAMRWTYSLRNRARWSDAADARRKQRMEALQTVEHLLADAGPARDLLDAIAGSRFLEVRIPHLAHDEGANWELRVLPWEYLLTAATSDIRRNRPLTVVRQLVMLDEVDAGRTAPSPEMFHLEVAPGRLRDEFNFDTERHLVALTARAEGPGRTPLAYVFEQDCSLQRARQAIREHKPRIIHVSGFDTHQGGALLRRYAEDGTGGLHDSDEPPDGLLMCTETRLPQIAGSEDLAQALVPDAVAPPRLIALNIHNSGPRTAGLCVAAGAHAAIGFQDSFDDRLAELFFSSFYLGGQTSAGDLAASLRFAMDVVAGEGRPLQGTGIVLWSRRSIQTDRPAQADLDVAAQDIRRAVTALGGPRIAGAMPPAPPVRLMIEPIAGLNYSILQNGGTPFERFVIAREDWQAGAIEDIDIQVELHVGSERFPFRRRLRLQAWEAAIDIGGEVRISLASSLGRSIQESIQTTLYVEVAIGARVVHRQTQPIVLLPVDEWRDDDNQRQWLPSFVLPRDPAVARIVDSAQRYLMALRDDPGCGFDGYQGIAVPARGQPALDIDEACAPVDMQVRAIWSALLFEHPLFYVNPPPSYSALSQRLRMPSDIIAGRRGTCIDLALLFAACLEYVEIYPAIVLLRGHAFPAYWRSAEVHDAFRSADSAAARRSAEKPAGERRRRGGFRTTIQTEPWYLTRGHYEEILAEVHAHHLVPVETTLVTAHSGFNDAVVEGTRNFTSARDFHSLLDIALARESGITPLPIRRKEP